jgi:hypothetical protein
MYTPLHNHINSFSSEISVSPDAKIAPIVVSGAVFLGKAIVGGAIGSVASWGTTRYLDNRFPAKK